MSPFSAPFRSALSPALDDALDRLHSIGERRGSRLQDDRGLDLVQLAGAHGGYVLPSGARGHVGRLEFLAAPGAEDHVRRAPRHLARIRDDAVLAERLSR